MRDIFIDNNIAVLYFKKPDKAILDFIKWLYDEDNLELKAHLVVSPKLLNEYFSSCTGHDSYTSITRIYTIMQAQGRTIPFTNMQVKKFQQKYFSKKVLRELTCNSKDRDHIPIVLMSNRKIAVSDDNCFLKDLQKFSGFKVIAGKHPKDLNYK
jgi:hypothetical protein